MFDRRIHRSIFIALLMLLAFGISQDGWSQIVENYEPADASILAGEIRLFGSDTTLKLGPGIYNMEQQLRFDANAPIIEGSGSGFGPEATILDFATYSEFDPDPRALSVRAAMTMRNLTIINVSGRVADLRTGTVGSPSNAPVIFENVWFVNNNIGLKSTGGRTVGTAETPMIVNNCVFANAGDYLYETSQQAVTLRDLSYAVFDHCDFFNVRELIDMLVDDPVAAPNEGPDIIIRNSILVGANGSGLGSESDDINIINGTLDIFNSVLWDSTANGNVEVFGGGMPNLTGAVIGDPRYVNVSTSILASDLDFALQSGSPASGLGSDGLNAGSVAGLPVHVHLWSIY